MRVNRAAKPGKIRGPEMSCNLRVRWIAVITLTLAGIAQAQTQPQPQAQTKNGVAFWEVDPQPVDALLQAAPRSDALRYQTLHSGFQKFQCTPELMEEQPAGKSGEKNLVCTLRGKTADRILVVARYDGRQGKSRPTWPDAMILMLLYHALQAQPREHTFVFAEIASRDGEKVFFDAERKRPQPAVTIVLDSLGMREPRLLMPPPPKHGEMAAEIQETQTVLQDQNLKTRALMGIPPRPPMRIVSKDEGEFMAAWYQALTESSLLWAAQRTPAALIYSDATMDLNVPPSAFHQDFDFLGWFLGGIDLKLAAKAETPSH
jgi:hypothetical protein